MPRSNPKVVLSVGLVSVVFLGGMATGGQAFAQCTDEQKLTASDADASADFGWSVSLSGDVALVGAVIDDCTAGSDCGSAYVLRSNGTSWVEEQKLTASDAGASDDFGSSVSVSGNTALVGAMTDDCAAGESCGSAYVFRFNGTSWVEEQRLTALDAAAFDWFGSSVSVSGDTAFVGASTDDCLIGGSCGSVYVFRFINGTSWVQVQKLTASDPTPAGMFDSLVKTPIFLGLCGA